MTQHSEFDSGCLWCSDAKRRAFLLLKVVLPRDGSVQFGTELRTTQTIGTSARGHQSSECVLSTTAKSANTGKSTVR